MIHNLNELQSKKKEKTNMYNNWKTLKVLLNFYLFSLLFN